MIHQMMQQVMQQNPEMMKEMMQNIMQEHGGIESLSQKSQQPQISADINGQKTVLSNDQIVNVLSQQQEALQKLQLEIKNKDKIISHLSEKIKENY